MNTTTLETKMFDSEPQLQLLSVMNDRQDRRTAVESSTVRSELGDIYLPVLRNGAWQLYSGGDFEPILSVPAVPAGDTVTYGRNKCAILTTQQVTVWDIDEDLPDHTDPDEDEQEAYSQRIHSVVSAVERTRELRRPFCPDKKRTDGYTFNSQFDYRLYQTSGSFRVLYGGFLDPHHADYAEISMYLRADLRYLVLSQLQGAYRLRLTPKPWRNTYLDCEQPQPVCRLLRSFNDDPCETILYHDRICGADHDQMNLY